MLHTWDGWQVQQHFDTNTYLNIGMPSCQQSLSYGSNLHQAASESCCSVAASAAASDPSIKTMQYAGSYYTVYPERVTWSEAAATCDQLPQGQLAVLDSQALLDAVARDLLATLPFQTAVRSAWVGATGNNTAYNPAAPQLSDIGNGSLQASLPPIAQPAVPTEQTLQLAIRVWHQGCCGGLRRSRSCGRCMMLCGGSSMCRRVRRTCVGG